MEEDVPSLVFKPSDKQLLDYFLRRKVEGRELHRDSLSLIPEISDIYGHRPPWEIFQDRREHYAFTKLVKLSDGGSRVNRKVNGGFWKLEKNDDVIDVDETSDGRVIRSKRFGKKKMLSFMSREGKMAKTSHWNMSEYTLPEWEHGDWVLCHVRFNHKAAAREEEKAAKDAARMRRNVEDQEASNTFMKEQEDYVHAPSLEWTCQDPDLLQHSAQQQDIEVSAAGNVATVNENEFMQGVNSWEPPDQDLFLGLAPVDCIPPTQYCGLYENQERDAITDSVAEAAFMQNVDPWKNPNDSFLGELDVNEEEFMQQGVDSWEPPDQDLFLGLAPVDCIPPTQDCGLYENQERDAITDSVAEAAFMQNVDPWKNPNDSFLGELDVNEEEFMQQGVDSWEPPDQDLFLGLAPVDCIPPTQDCGLYENQERDAITDSVAEAAFMQNVDPWKNPNDSFLGELDVNEEEFMQQGVDYSWEPPDNDFFLDLAPVDYVPSPPQECDSSKNQEQEATTGGSMAEAFMQEVDLWVPSDPFLRDLDAWAADEFAKMG